MKKWIAFLLAAVMLLAGCAASGTATEFTPEVQKEIEEAWLKEKGHELGIWFGEPNEFGIYGSWRVKYMGNVDGYFVLFYPAEAWLEYAEGLLEVGNVTFNYSRPFELILYKDGDLINIEDAYASGSITAETVDAIYETYKSNLA